MHIALVRGEPPNYGTAKPGISKLETSYGVNKYIYRVAQKK